MGAVKCGHAKTRALYEQRPPSEGRKLKAVADKCEACGAILPRGKQGKKTLLDAHAEAIEKQEEPVLAGKALSDALYGTEEVARGS